MRKIELKNEIKIYYYLLMKKNVALVKRKTILLISTSVKNNKILQSFNILHST